MYFSMSFMTAVFSYNRGDLLANCVRSIEEFSPPTTLVIFDDRSDDPDTEAELARIAKRGHEVITSENLPTGAYGNLFKNFTRAVELARERGFSLLHFVEDDMQFVRRSSSLPDDAAAVFRAFPRAAQVSAMFWKYATKARGTLHERPAVYEMQQAPGCGLGFLDVHRLQASGFQHQPDEATSVRLGGSLGLKFMTLAFPVVARVPWPMYSRFRAMKGRRVTSAKPYLIKPLEEADIARLMQRDLTEPPYHEHYCLPWGWRCWQPYGWTASHSEWIKILLIVARHRRSVRGLIPRRVGSLD
jgi:hypothetical protein